MPVRRERLRDFPLDPGIVMLNHASYGVTTYESMAGAERLRREIEADPLRMLGTEELTPRLRAQADVIAEAESLDPALTTLCANATSGAAAVIDSVRLRPGAAVVVLDTEYSSVQRAWAVRCERADASMIRVPVPVPLHGAAELIGALDAAVPGEVAYLQLSLVSSSAAIHLPVAEVSAWTRGRGGRVVLDAAHGPGHVPLRPGAWGVAAMFGTVHKWYPTLRPVGLLWLDGALADRVRPAEVSLTWESPDLVERFSWPGTFDPVSRLGVRCALGQWRAWRDTGALEECRRLANLASDLLVEAGAVPAAAPGLTPPRLRAFVMPGLDPGEVKADLLGAGVRAWVGRGPRGECLVRVSPHVYNDARDIEVLVTRIRALLRKREDGR